MATDPKDTTTPTTSLFVTQVADEFRSLKTRINFLEQQALRAPGVETLNALPNVAGRANQLLGFNAAGQPIPLAAPNGTAADVLTTLADSGNISKGAGAIAYNSTLPYLSGTVGDELRGIHNQIVAYADPAIAAAVANRMQYSIIAAQPTTSGLAKDFFGIPSWAKRVTLLFDGVSTTGTNNIAVRLGTTSGIEATGYAGTTVYYLGGSNGAVSLISTGVSIYLGAPDVTRAGRLTFYLLSGNRWGFDGMIVNTGSAGPSWVAGQKTLAGVLDRIRVTTNDGSDNFDAGALTLLIEG